MVYNRFGPEIFSESESPSLLDGVANLVDVMLVLACGLMLALVINWNVDISPGKPADSQKADELRTELEFTGDTGEDLDADADYEELGVVYRDPATGKLYLVTEGQS
jgi:hypothetical protein